MDNKREPQRLIGKALKKKNVKIKDEDEESERAVVESSGVRRNGKPMPDPGYGYDNGERVPTVEFPYEALDICRRFLSGSLT